MIAPCTALSLWLLVAAGPVQVAAPSGIFVRENAPEHRVEFLPGGKCFRSSADVSEGSYSGDGAALVCKFGDKSEFRFRRDGRALVDKDGHRWVPREDVDKIPWKDSSPVTVVVLAEKTRKPITRFSYVYTIRTPAEEYSPLLVRPTEVRSAQGAFTIPAPELCEIEIGIKSEEIERGGVWWHGRLAKGEKNRKIEILAKPGATVQGIAVDSETGKPIEGATVSPMAISLPFGPELPDEDRAVKTDRHGKFTIRGVDESLDVNVSHPGYLLFRNAGAMKNAKRVGERLYEVRAALRPGERFFGAVKDPSGRPVSGVAVSDGVGVSTQTGKDGSFALVSGVRDSYAEYKLWFAKKDYFDASVTPDAADPKGLSVVLRPLPVLSGRVLRPDGQPATALTVSTIAAGFGSERPPPKCSSATVHDPEGRFSLPVNMTCHDDEPYGGPWKIWVGVKAPGFAFWETTVDAWEGKKSIAVSLRQGIAVRGLVKVPKDRVTGVSAGLVSLRIPDDPFEEGTSQRQEMGKLVAKPDSRGAFRFEHVAPGRYWLVVSGPAISPAGKEVTVSGSDRDGGSFAPRGRGSVCGVVYRTRTAFGAAGDKPWVWAFAEGSIYSTDSSGQDWEGEFPNTEAVPFRADSKGRFRVDGIPVGTVSVNVPYMISSDFASALSRTATVVEGKTAEVNISNDPGDAPKSAPVASPVPSR